MVTVELTKGSLRGMAKAAESFRNMAVRECGYNLCLDMCRAADTMKEDQFSVKIKATALSIPMNLSKGTGRVNRHRLRYLRAAYGASRQLSTLLMLSHDLNYLPTEEYLDLNSKANIFAAKLHKFIRYSSKKLKLKSK